MDKICYWDEVEGVQKERDATPEEQAEINARRMAAAAPSVPSQVTMRQARLALLKAGKLAAVQPAIDALPSPDREEAQIEWDYSSVVERDRHFVAVLAPALGLSDADLDALFIQAAAL